MNNNQEIELNLNVTFHTGLWCYNFNSKDEFIIYGNWKHNKKNKYYKEHKIIWIYSTHTKNEKWICKRLYEIPENFGLISILEDKLYLLSNNCIYEWDLSTKKNIKIFSEKTNFSMQ